MKKIIVLFVGILCLMGGSLQAQSCSDRIQSAKRIYEKYKQSHDKKALDEACNLLRNVKSMSGVSESCVQEADRLLKAWKPSSGSSNKGDGTIKYATEDRTGLGLNDDEIEFSGSGGEDAHIWVTCSEAWKVSNSNDWFEVKTEGDNLRVICTANPEKEQREGQFYVITKSGTSAMIVTVLQDVKDPMAATLNLSKETLNVGENAKCYPIAVTTTEEWTTEVVEGDKWCTVEKKGAGELNICVEDNPGKNRTAMVKVKVVDGIEKLITVEQDKHGYQGITQSYLETLGGDWKTTRFFFDLYAMQSFGFRIGGLAKRWRYVEFSLLDFDVELASLNFTNWRVRVDWEPMVRGFLPLSRRDRCWSLFMGVGASVNIVNIPLVSPSDITFVKENAFVFELGAEYYWSKKENVSSRIFYRLEAGPMWVDGLKVSTAINSIGISFDLYEWHQKFSRK
ncbi:MAG: hypothetical protein J6X16_05620 [Bacteroidales bacterium]|nr:hypothetical protein [Bacteroidales bacterium]